MKTLIQILIFFVCLQSSIASGQTVVTTYVTKVQEERKSTRFTLTEWLRIKERMKLMDVWLAMFSSPQKDKFRLELNFNFLSLKGDLEDEAGSALGTTNHAQGELDIWLTNIISSTLGVRTLNIDLGLMGGFHRYKTTPLTGANTETWNLTARGAQFRLFGDHVQDTSLVVQYGTYGSENTIVGADPERSGIFAGAGLDFYFFHGLGLEGSYRAYGTQTQLDSEKRRGTYFDYAGFLEISFLRLVYGAYQLEWHDLTTPTVDKGMFGGLRMFF